MASETGNTKARKEQFGSGNDNPRQQEQMEADPNRSNARDREGRKGGSNAKNL